LIKSEGRASADKASFPLNTPESVYTVTEICCSAIHLLLYFSINCPYFTILYNVEEIIQPFVSGRQENIIALKLPQSGIRFAAAP
jgi:hypothetical protein